MFYASRRGPATLSRVFRATSTNHSIPFTRPSTLSLSLQSITKPSIESRWLHVSSQLRNRAAEAGRPTGERPEGTQVPVEVTKFDELIEHKLVHPNVVNEITRRMGHHTMTQVQSMTINQALQGDDIVAQARTGTGKTLGFLLPTIQNILRKDPQLGERKRYSRARPSDIRAIIISPTRELAEQIAVEAEKLCAATDLRVQVAVGGNSKRAMLRKMQMEGCHLLVATPGRLNDLLTDQYSKVSAPDLTTLVLDEADRLLDEGFSRDIEAIIDLLPDRNMVDRQTMLFSATIPKEVMHLVRRTLKPGFHFVQGVHEGEPATHEKVPQKLVATPGIENFMPALLELAKREIEKISKAHLAGEGGKPFKAIVYFGQTANVELAGRIFEELRGEEGGVFGTHPLYPAEISQMHGQLTQAERTRVSERFRRAKSAMLFSTDVTARGMDFPNVSHVIQVGLPPSTEQYIHRIGRTGRGDKTGEGWIFVVEDDIREARRRLGDLPITADKTLEAAKLDMTREAQLPTSLAATLGQISAAVKMVDRETKARAYIAALGMSVSGGMARVQVPLLNNWTKYGWGWPEPPSVPLGLAQKLGIARLPGVNLQGSRRFDEDADDSLNGAPRIREGRDGDRFGGGGGSRGGFGGRGGDRGGRDFGRRDSYDDRRGGGRSSFGRENRGSGRSSGFGDPRAQF